VLLAILGAWLVCAVLVAIAFAAIGRSGLQEDQALGHVPRPGTPPVSPTGATERSSTLSRTPGG